MTVGTIEAKQGNTKVETPQLTVVRDDIGPCQVKLDIEVPCEWVDDVLAKVTKRFQKVARVPGFRPGKTPRGLLLNRYRSQVLEEARDRLVREAVEKAAESEGLTFETNPRVTEEDKLQVVEGNSFVFSITFDTPPQFVCPEYKGMAVSRGSAEVGDADVEECIGSILERRTSYEQVDRAAEQGDLAKVTYHGKLSDPDAVVPETAQFFLDAEETWVTLRDQEILPGSIAALTGMSPGEEKEIIVLFPDGFFEASLAGHTGTYTLKLLEVHTAEVPELTDEVAKDLGGESAEQVRESVRIRLGHDRQQQQERAAREQIVQKLMDAVDFELPPTVVARDTYNTLLQLLNQEAKRGRSQEELREAQEEMAERAREIARNRLKRYYILRSVAQAEEIEATSREVSEALSGYARIQNVSEKVMRRRLVESGAILDLATSIRDSKTIDRLLELADVSDADPGQDAETQQEE